MKVVVSDAATSKERSQKEEISGDDIGILIRKSVKKRVRKMKVVLSDAAIKFTASKERSKKEEISRDDVGVLIRKNVKQKFKFIFPLSKVPTKWTNSKKGRTDTKTKSVKTDKNVPKSYSYCPR